MFNSFNPSPLRRRKIVLYKKLYLSDLFVVILGFIFTILLIYSLYATSLVLAFTVGLSPGAIAFLSLIPIDDNHKIWNAAIIGIAYPFLKKRYKGNNQKNLIPYKEIKDGLLVTKTNELIKFIKIEGFNFLTLTESESHTAVSVFRDIIREINVSFSLYATDMPIDYKENFEYLNSLKKKANEDIWKISSKTLDILANQEKTEEKSIYLVLYGSSIERINEEALRLKSRFSDANLMATLINKKISIMGIVKKYYNCNDDIEKISDLLGKNTKTNFGVNNFKMNGKYTRIISVSKFPFESSLGWLYPLMSIGGISFMMNLELFDLRKAIRKIDAAASEAQGSLMTTYRQSELSKSENEAELMAALSNQIHQENEIVLSTYSYFIIQADTTKELKERLKTLKNVMASHQINIGYLSFRQKEAFDAALPKLHSSLKRISSIELPSSSLANSFPFHKDALNDKDGLYLGYSRNGENIFFNPFLLWNKRKNHNINVLGNSGGGKTTMVSKIIKDAWLRGSKIIIIDPQAEYIKITKELNGVHSDLGANSKNTKRINPLEFFRTSETSISVPEHMQFLESFFKVIFPEMTDIEWSELNMILSSLYRERKINGESDPKEFPILKDLSLKVDKEFEMENDNQHRNRVLYNLSSYLKRFQDKNAPESVMWNGNTNFNINDNRFFTFDIHSIGASQNDRLINAQYYLIIKFTFSQMILNRIQNNKQESNQKMLILVDEAHKLINEKIPAGLEFLYEMSKTIRKFGGGLIVTTQNMADLLGGSEYIKQKTSALINNAQYSLYFQMNPDDLSKLQKMAESSSHQFSSEEKDYIVGAKRGEFLMSLTPTDRKMATLDVSDEERYIWKNKDEI